MESQKNLLTKINVQEGYPGRLFLITSNIYRENQSYQG